MRKSALASILTLALVLSSCTEDKVSLAQKSPRMQKSSIDEVHTVEWFADEANAAVYEEIRALCRNNPGEYRNKPNCINVAAVERPENIEYAHVSEGLSLADGARSAVTEFATANGYWSKDNAGASIASPSSIVEDAVEIDEVHTVEWLADEANTAVYEKIRALCRNNPGEYKDKPNCINVAAVEHPDNIKRNHVSKSLSLVAGVKSAVAEFGASNGYWPRDNAEAGIASPSSIAGDAVASITVSGDGIDLDSGKGTIIVEFNQKVDPDATLVIETTGIPAGTIQWTCEGGGSMKAKWLPVSCRQP